jgi:hypothetical protein
MLFRGTYQFVLPRAAKGFVAQPPLFVRQLSTVNRGSRINRAIAAVHPARPGVPTVDFNDADIAFRVGEVWAVGLRFEAVLC